MPRKAKEKNIKLNNDIDAKETHKVDSVKEHTQTIEKVSNKNIAKGNKSNVKKEAKSTSKAITTTSKPRKKKPQPIVEYYDLPFRYNQTMVKILAQTPNILFIYWDISDEDRKKYENEYGTDFFKKTRPYLIITNKTKNYTFEVEVNDFANSWYLHVNDADCDYLVELGRKFIENSTFKNEDYSSYSVNDYLPITSSNNIEMPNNHILFDKLGKSIFFRNTKTNIVTKKDISTISFMKNMGKVYNIYDLYKEIYKDELTGDEFKLNFPSSNNSSKTFEEEM